MEVWTHTEDRCAGVSVGPVFSLFELVLVLVLVSSSSWRKYLCQKCQKHEHMLMWLHLWTVRDEFIWAGSAGVAAQPLVAQPDTVSLHQMKVAPR